MMTIEATIRRQVRMILEKEKKKSPESEDVSVRGRGRGSYKKTVREAGALAVENPAQLMKNLKISGPAGKEDIEILFSLVKQAASGADAMAEAYGIPKAVKDKFGRKGVRVGVGGIQHREGIRFMEHSILGMMNAGILNVSEDIQVESVGGEVLIYFSKRQLKWGRPMRGKGRRKKATPTQPKKDETSAA